MKNKIKILFISFITIIIFHLTVDAIGLWELGLLSPHVGLLFVYGLLFGPYGALGAVMGNVIINLNQGYAPMEILPSAIFSFGISLLAYKLWYSGNINHIIMFLFSIIICGLIFSIVHGALLYWIFEETLLTYFLVQYFLNFVNTAFIVGILSIWLSEKIDLIETPKTSKKPVNKKLYRSLFYLILVSTIATAISLKLHADVNIIIAEIILMGIFLFG